MNIKNILLAGMALGVAGSSRLPETNIESNSVSVPWGEFGYTTNTKDIHSKGYASCSAVVIDDGDGAILAHAFPSEGVEFLQYSVDAENVVDKTIGDLRAKGVDVASCRAFVSAGNKKDLNEIVSDLRDYKIEIDFISLDEGIARNIKYSPKSNNFKVDYVGRNNF